MTLRRLIVILGGGPGIGTAMGARFASEGFDVALLARNALRLKEAVTTVKEAGGPSSRVGAYPVDIGDHVALTATLKLVEMELGRPEVVHFNAATLVWTKIGETDPDVLLSLFKTMNVGLVAAANWACPHLIAAGQQRSDLDSSDAHPSFFLSGGPIQDTPFADLFVLSMQKAAQINFMGSLSQVLGPREIHVASVNIGGAVSDEEPVLNAKNIASTFWKLYQQDKAEWDFEIKLGGMDYWSEQKARSDVKI